MHEGTGVGVAIHKPLQVTVCVQMDPVGHAGPPTAQGTVYLGGRVVVIVGGGSAANATGKRESQKVNFMIYSHAIEY